MTDNLIEISDLYKSFGPVAALRGVNLQVNRGSVHGFLGPNGAGKSTAIRCLFGMLRPDNGTIRLGGYDPTRNPTQATVRAAYVPGDVNLWPNLTGGQVIKTLSRIRHKAAGTLVSDAEKARQADLINRFVLDPNKKIRAYSKGNRQKVILVAALSADVDVLVLDEPTSGLDPLIQQEFLKAVRERRDEGVAVLMSSHILSEIQEVADVISIIRAGEIVESGPLASLSHMRGMRIRAVTATGETYDQLHSGAEINATLQELVHRNATDISCCPVSLEELFMQHYQVKSPTAATATVLKD